MIRNLTSGAARHLRRNLIAYVALLFALGGTSYAAADRLLPRNSVGSAQVVNGSLKKADLNKATVSALHGARGDQGPPGAQGPPGPSTGPAGGALTGNYPNPQLAADAVNGSKVQNDSLTGADIQESSLGEVPSATNATNAGTATNADNLGGVAASLYQRGCQPGAIDGHAYVKGSSTFPNTYTSSAASVLDQFNCTGTSPAAQAKRIATGIYYLDFPGIQQGVGNGLLTAIGNVTVDSGGTQDPLAVVTYKFVFDAVIGKTVFRVEISSGGALVDREFSFTLLG